MFESKNCGFQIWVTPIVKNSINLEGSLRVESRTFGGFVNYGGPIRTGASDWLGNPVNVLLTDNRIVTTGVMIEIETGAWRSVSSDTQGALLLLLRKLAYGQVGAASGEPEGRIIP